MKKLLLLFAVVGMTLGFSSCKDECCDCGSSGSFQGEICEDNFPSAFGSWDDYKTQLEAAGCSCD